MVSCLIFPSIPSRSLDFAMAAILAAAAASATTGFFGKSSSLSAYTTHSVPSSSSGSNSSALTSSIHPKPFIVGLWRLTSATHRTTGTEVTVWTFEKSFIDRLNPSGKDQVISALKREASSLSRFRHPTLLNIVEPLEETRGELTWVSEAVTASLASILTEAEKASLEIKGAVGSRSEGTMRGLSIDEVEIQKGVLQVTHALAFLHKAKLVHLNVNPEAILINAKGDWKLSGLTHAIPLLTPEGHSTPYTYPDLFPSLPPHIQWKLDYLDPIYALDSTLSPSNDLYALGCVLYALHVGGRPPWRNEGRMGSLGKNVEEGLREGGGVGPGGWRAGRKWDAVGAEARGGSVAILVGDRHKLMGSSSLFADLINRLITRTISTRISEQSLSQHPYFRSLAVSILNYLEPTTFSSKSREEKSTFLQGLSKQIPSFSERLRTRKILPSLIEQTRDTGLLGLLIPAITDIARGLPGEDFAGSVMRPMAGLFGLKDPPQALLALLDLVPIAQSKASRSEFQSNMMPLIYNALESEHPPVQEKALQIIPKIVDSLDVSVLQDVLLVKIAILFSKTKLLAVKVGSLECFLALVPSLDKSFLTTKLVPLLARIKTKEPTVVMATLRLHEAMGMKVDYAAVASLILPQLWTMSTAPTLSLEQYQFFVRVIKSLGDRVEREHTAHLRAAGQTQSNGSNTPMSDNWVPSSSSDMTFEKLLNGGAGSMHAPSLSNGIDATLTNGTRGAKIDDPWDTPTLSGLGFDATRPASLGGIATSATMPQMVSAIQPTHLPSTTSLPFNPLQPSSSTPSFPSQPIYRPHAAPSPSSVPSHTTVRMTSTSPATSATNPAQSYGNNRHTAAHWGTPLAAPPLHIPSVSYIPGLSASTSSSSNIPPLAQFTPILPLPNTSYASLQPLPSSLAGGRPNPEVWNPSSAPSNGMPMGMGIMQPMKPVVQQQAMPSLKDMDWSDFDPLK